ncbi:DUF3592 domain-containing protein [Planctomycetota bacterium]
MKLKNSVVQMPSWVRPVRIAARIIGIVMILDFIGVLGLGIYFSIKTNKFLETAVKTKGKVVVMEEDYSSDDTMYCPTFTFIDNTGKKHRVRSSLSSYPPKYEVGDTIPILYDPQNPSNADVDSFSNLWLGSVIAFVLSVPPLILGILFAFVLPFVFTRIGVHLAAKNTEQEH